MLETLPLVLFVVMTEVSIGSFAVLVLLDWRNEVKRGFLISYALIYLFTTALTYWFQQGFATPELLNSYTQLDKAWTGYLTPSLLAFLLLMIPYTVLLLADKKAGVEKKGEESTDRQGFSVLRLLRLLSGALTLVVGLLTLLVVAMIYRPLASANFGGLFTVAGFFAAAFALGGVLTAMWLGHWYLVTPALSEKPLQFSTTLVLIAIVAQILFMVVAGPVSASTSKPAATSQQGQTAISAAPARKGVKPVGAPVVTPLSTDAIGWIRILISFILPLVLGGLAWKLVRDRSFQSATGMLYLIVVCTLAGEAMARGLFLVNL